MKIIKTIVMVALVAFTIGCLRIEQDVVINRDGSGKFQMTYGMQEQMVRQMEAMQAMQTFEEDGDDEELSPFNFNLEQVRESMKKYEEHGLKVRNVSSETKDDWRYMKIQLEFDSIAALAKTEFFEDSNMKLNKVGDRYVFEMKSEEEEPDEMSAQMMEQMAPMFAGMRVAMNIRVPGRIVEHNATEVKGQTASWVFDVDKDPGAYQKIQQMNIRVVFEGEGIELPNIDD